MGTLLTKLIPSWVPLALGGVLIVSLVSGFFLLRSAYREQGRAEVRALDAEAIVEQNKKDAALSASLISELKKKVEYSNEAVSDANKAIDSRPVVRSNNPVFIDAAHGVCALVPETCGSPTGVKPNGGLSHP